MIAAQIIVDVVHAGGGLQVDVGEIVARNVPSHLIPLIREHKAALMALLQADSPQSAPAMPPVPALPGPFGVGTVTERPDGSMLIEYHPAMEITRPPVQEPAPATVSCGSCAEFQPGTTALGVGVCLSTANGLPPKQQRGYLAAYPMAPRSCPVYQPKEQPHG